MKREFYLTPFKADYRGMKIEIMGSNPNDKPYITFGYIDRTFSTLDGADLERVAVNILKAIGSKKLKP